MEEGGRREEGRENWDKKRKGERGKWYKEEEEGRRVKKEGLG